MLKVNGTEIKNVKFNGVDLDKVIVNGVIVFEKVQFNNTVTMRTLQDSITIKVQTKDLSPCEVWNAGNKIGVLNNDQSTSIPIPNKNEDVIIKGKDITSLDCYYNQLTNLNVQGLNSLQSLDCFSNQLTSLNVQGLNSLQSLNCSSNQLTSLDVQGLNSLQSLSCSDNQLTSLNVQGLTALQYLYCSSNQLTSLNVQGLNSLQYLNCSDNQLTSLNVQGLNSLQSLSCYYNQLTNLNVQGLTALQTLYCFNNQLSAQAFKEIFNSLLETENGKAVVYNDNDNNYKDFTHPPELLEAFNGAKARGWKFYKNYEDDSNLI